MVSLYNVVILGCETTPSIACILASEDSYTANQGDFSLRGFCSRPRPLPHPLVTSNPLDTDTLLASKPDTLQADSFSNPA